MILLQPKKRINDIFPYLCTYVNNFNHFLLITMYRPTKTIFVNITDNR